MFENFKRKLQDRIERNAVKIPNVTWKDNQGNVHTEDIVIKRSKLPFIGDWSRIHPPIDENDKINWINLIFGGRANFIKLIAVLTVVAFILLAFQEIFSQYSYLRELCEPYIKQLIRP